VRAHSGLGGRDPRALLRCRVARWRQHARAPSETRAVSAARLRLDVVPCGRAPWCCEASRPVRMLVRGYRGGWHAPPAPAHERFVPQLCCFFFTVLGEKKSWRRRAANGRGPSRGPCATRHAPRRATHGRGAAHAGERSGAGSFVRTQRSFVRTSDVACVVPAAGRRCHRRGRAIGGAQGGALLTRARRAQDGARVRGDSDLVVKTIKDGARVRGDSDLVVKTIKDGVFIVRSPPPSLPYQVDTSRPSLRTNWTRLAQTRGEAGTPRGTSAAPPRARA